MTPRGKKVLIISAGLLAIGGVLGYIFWNKAKKKKEEQEKADADAKAKALEIANQGGGTVGGTAGVTTGGSTGGSATTPTLSNFDSLQKNLNLKAKNGVVIVPFNGGKNVANFYNNNRVILFATGQSGVLKKGTYSNGGLTFVIDGGKTISSGSVWVNLINALT